MRRVLGAMVIAAVGVSGCSVVGGGGGHYTLTAYFSKTISLYTSSDVRVLGLHAGKVASVKADGNRVRVVLHVDKSIPVPADVHASIIPLSLIGERYIQLYPAWTVGQPRATDGAVIPLERTDVPVEPDEALAAVKKFLDTLDPDATGRLVKNLGEDLKGTGPGLNEALDGLSKVAATLADKDEALGRIIDQFDTFTAAVSTREAQLGRVMDEFATMTGMLADERRALEDLLKGLAQVSSDALDLVSENRAQLDRDLTILTRTLQSVKANIGSVGQLLDSGPILVKGTLGAYSPQFHRIDLRNSVSPTVAQGVQALGLPIPNVVCLPIDVSCSLTALRASVAAPAGSPAASPASSSSPAAPVAPNPLDALVALLGPGDAP